MRKYISQPQLTNLLLGLFLLGQGTSRGLGDWLKTGPGDYFPQEDSCFVVHVGIPQYHDVSGYVGGNSLALG